MRELARARTADEEARLQTAPIVRGLIDRVVINPNGGMRGVNIEVFGKLASLLTLATGEEQTSAMYAVSGAGEGIGIIRLSGITLLRQRSTFGIG